MVRFAEPCPEAPRAKPEPVPVEWIGSSDGTSETFGPPPVIRRG